MYKSSRDIILLYASNNLSVNIHLSYATSAEVYKSVVMNKGSIEMNEEQIEMALDSPKDHNVEVFEENTKAEKSLVWKIDRWLMPTCWILLLFNYVGTHPSFSCS